MMTSLGRVAEEVCVSSMEVIGLWRPIPKHVYCMFSDNHVFLNVFLLLLAAVRMYFHPAALWLVGSCEKTRCVTACSWTPRVHGVVVWLCLSGGQIAGGQNAEMPRPKSNLQRRPDNALTSRHASQSWSRRGFLMLDSLARVGFCLKSFSCLVRAAAASPSKLDKFDILNLKFD